MARTARTRPVAVLDAPFVALATGSISRRRRRPEIAGGAARLILGPWLARLVGPAVGLAAVWPATAGPATPGLATVGLATTGFPAVGLAATRRATRLAAVWTIRLAAGRSVRFAAGGALGVPVSATRLVSHA